MENNTQESNMITLKSILSIIEKNILIILIITILFIGAGSVYAFKYKATNYTATATVMVDNAQTTEQSDINSGNYSISINMVKTFKDFISSNVVAKDAVEKLKAKSPKYENLTIAGVLAGISFVGSSDTSSVSLIITINFTKANDQIGAVEIVNQIVESAVELANTPKEGAPNEYKYKGLANNLVVVDEIDLENDYYRINLDKFVPGTRGATKTIIICALIGFVISAIIVMIKYLLNDTFISKKEFENLYNITVFSMIPYIADKK